MKKLLLAVLFFLAIPAHAATYYVSKAGDDANACSTTDSAATNKLTIQNSITNCLSAGDTLIIHAGTYAESISLSGKNGSATAYFHIQAASGETVIIAPTSTRNEFTSASYIEITSIVFDCYSISDTCIGFNGATAGHHVIIQDSEIKNTGRNIGDMGSCPDPSHVCGTNGVTGGDNISLLRNHIHDNGNGGGDHGVYMETDNSIFDGNEIDHNSGFGIQKYATGDNNIIRNNLLHDNGQSGFLNTPSNSAGAGLISAGGTNNLIYNNISYGNYDQGITLNYNENGSFVYNNTVYGNGSAGGGIEINGTGHTVRNNIVYNNTGSEINDAGTATVLSYNLCESGCTGTGTVNGNPLFIDAANADFRLSVGSPAINAGTTIAAFNTDILGTARPQGAAWDIGAYEFPSGTPGATSVITFDDASSGNNSAATITVSHTTGDHPDRVAILTVDWDTTGGVTLSSVTYNSDAATLLCTATQNSKTLKQYLLIAPDTGTHDAVFTFSGTPSMNHAGGAISTFYNVEQTTAVRASGSTNGTGTSVTNTVATLSGDMVVDGIGPLNATATATGTQTVDIGMDDNFGILYTSHATASSTTTGMPWTNSMSTDWMSCATPLKPTVDTGGITFRNVFTSPVIR